MTINYQNTPSDIKNFQFKVYTQFFLLKNLLPSFFFSVFFSHLILPSPYGYGLLVICSTSFFVLYNIALLIIKYWLPLRKALKDQPQTIISQSLSILDNGLKHIEKNENIYLWTSIKLTNVYADFFIIHLASDKVLLIPFKGQKTDDFTNFIGLINEKTPLPQYIPEEENAIPILNNLAVFTSFIPLIGLLAVTGFYLAGNISFKRKNSIRLIGLGLILNISIITYFIITF